MSCMDAVGVLVYGVGNIRVRPGQGDMSVSGLCCVLRFGPDLVMFGYDMVWAMSDDACV